MICKFCNAEIASDSKFCTVCGQPLTEETQPEEELTAAQETQQEEVAEEAVTVVPAQSEEVQRTEDLPDEPVAVISEELHEEKEPPFAKPKQKVWPIVLAAVGSVVALAVLAVVLLVALGVEIKLPSNDIFRKEAYTVEDDQAVKKADDVVAKIGDAKLTNAQLQIYYRMQVLDFVNYYGSYLSSIGFDYTQPLSTQTCYFDETMTWEQYFIDVAIKTWQNYQILALEANEAGFTLDETWETELAAIPAAMEEQAAEGEYESADAMIKELLGPGCDMDDYMEYIRLNSLSNEYYASEYEKLTPTDEEVEAYFTENEAVFAESGVTKDSGLVSSVRHILVCPKAEETTEEEGTSTEATETTEATEAETEGFTDAQWAACLAEAEKILEEWKNGEATEESFAALVATYTEDPGSASTGGLYENITPTSSYVENFLNWSVDMSRQPGDTGIVQTEYGYHIMYFVSGEAQWINTARTQLLSERTSKLISDATEAHPMTVTYKKIALSELELA